MSDVHAAADPAPTNTAEPPTPASTTPESAPRSEATAAPRKTLLNQEPEKAAEGTEPKKEGEPEKKEEAKPSGPPEKYEFKAPEGFELDEKVVGEASELFKKHGLSQETAQALVDFYGKQAAEIGQAPYKAWADQQEGWIKEVKAEHGSNLNEVRASIGRAIESLGPELATKFRDAMEYTGAGNNPAFVTAMHKWSKNIGEGSAVRGNGPGDQTVPDGKPATMAQAMYPHLPSTAKGS